jgi:aspartate/methionine/tyrosine aminotransferase
MAALVEPGDEILIEQPTYELIVSTAEYLGARVVRFPRRFGEHFQIDPGEIGRAVTARTRLIVITNLHNPGSAFADEETLLEVGRIARRVRARVLVDEVYLDAAFDARPSTSFKLGEEFIATGSLTKVYGLSGLRCGWIFAEPVLATRIWRLADLFYSTLPHVAELLAVAAFRQLPAIESRARKLLDANRALFNRMLLPRTDLEVHEHTRGLIAFPRLKSGESTHLCRLLRERFDTAVVPGSFFGMPDHIRIGLGGATAEVEEGLRCLAAALDELGRPGQGGETGQRGQRGR